VFTVRSIATLAAKEDIQREVFFRTWLENGTQAWLEPGWSAFRLNGRRGCRRKPASGTKTSSWRVPLHPLNSATADSRADATSIRRDLMSGAV
jgi:uncharacterized membrane-anchored protein